MTIDIDPEAAVTIAVLFVVAAVMVYLALRLARRIFWRSGRRAKPPPARCAKEVKAYFEGVYESGALPIVATKLLLGGEERAHLEERVELYETRPAWESSRGWMAVRPVQGSHVGRAKGKSVPDGELRRIDDGMLTLTNRRLVFSGKSSSRDNRLDHVLSVERYADGIGITVEARQKDQVYVGIANPWLWESLIRFIKEIPPSGELPKIDLEIH